jgi:diadenosine tetraphosphate (Ap4A) HIT family hydrolase
VELGRPGCLTRLYLGEEQVVRYEIETGWPSGLALQRRISAYARVDRAYSFKIGITGRPKARWAERYRSTYDEMVVIYSTSSEKHVKQIEREMTDFFDGYSDNIVAGGGGGPAGPPFYLYVVFTRKLTQMGFPPSVLAPERWVASNELAFAIRDGFPVSDGHTLVVPRRHVATWAEATAEERSALMELAEQVRLDLTTELDPDGFNIGVNVGEAAGQTIMHMHVHVIPRWFGDVENPRGGVRHVIPYNADYLKEP